MILKMHYNYDENTYSMLTLQLVRSCFVQETRSSLLMTQLKRYVRQIPASLMVYLAFTHSALALSFNIDTCTLFLINLQNISALFCLIKSFHLHALV